MKKRIAWDANRVPKEQGHRDDAYDLITRGNIKLGSDVWKFSLPVSAEACPGATPWCRQFCYAKEGWYIRKLIQNIRDQNWTAAQAGDFVQRLQRDIHRANPNLFRIHDSGDFFSVSYIEAWERVIEAFPVVHFWAFTHSWRVPELLPALEQLRQRPNLQIFASTDADTGAPPVGWRVAAMVGLDFAGVPCLFQTGQKPNCSACGFCYKALKQNVVWLYHGKKSARFSELQQPTLFQQPLYV